MITDDDIGRGAHEVSDLITDSGGDMTILDVPSMIHRGDDAAVAIDGYRDLGAKSIMEPVFAFADAISNLNRSLS